MISLRSSASFCAAIALVSLAAMPLMAQSAKAFGYRDFSHEARIEAEFLKVPSATLAGQHMKRLTAEPHLSATPGDYRSAQYVAAKFRAAGLETTIVPYKVLLNHPIEERLEAWNDRGEKILGGMTPEHVKDDPWQGRPGISMPFHGSSASGDITAELVYANFGRPEDFATLAAHHIDVRGKIVIARYGSNFRGVKAWQAEAHGAIGLLIYSDPHEDGPAKGSVYPDGPWRPDTAVQMGAVQYLFDYPGDPTTPGVASTMTLPASQRTPADKTGNQPHIPSLPISYHDAEPLLRALSGPQVPAEWQGSLPFDYHMGGSGARVHLLSRQDYKLRTIWNVLGKIKGSKLPGEEVVIGNHRDAWIYGAVDPVSGTAAMLETVHGIGALLKQGWRPERSILFASWDAEEQGLVGSTEWVEQHMAEAEHIVAYFNTDVAVSGPDFSASAVPSLKRFLTEVTASVPSPLGSTVYQQWLASSHKHDNELRDPHAITPASEVELGNLGSGSDFTPFLQHAGIPASDIGSDGPYGVYHSVFDNYQWFVRNADPKFVYEQEMARVLGIEALRMADADTLPLDYTTYAHQISVALEAAEKRVHEMQIGGIDFAPAETALQHFAAQATRATHLVEAPPASTAAVNHALRQTETAFLSNAGLPNRPWYRHTIFAPGIATGYAVVMLPGVNEALDAHNAALANQQLQVIAASIESAARVLAQAR